MEPLGAVLFPVAYDDGSASLQRMTIEIDRKGDGIVVDTDLLDGSIAEIRHVVSAFERGLYKVTVPGSLRIDGPSLGLATLLCMLSIDDRRHVFSGEVAVADGVPYLLPVGFVLEKSTACKTQGKPLITPAPGRVDGVLYVDRIDIGYSTVTLYRNDTVVWEGRRRGRTRLTILR